MSDIFRRTFFPKWRAALKEWMTSPDVDYLEVVDWYKEWKSRFPKALLSHRIMATEWMLTLKMMEDILA